MFQLIRSLSTSELAARQGPVFAVAFVVASLFYKFGSFALEAVAFLITWFVLDALVELFLQRLHRPVDDKATG
jgi:hypothetical protein